MYINNIYVYMYLSQQYAKMDNVPYKSGKNLNFAEEG